MTAPGEFASFKTADVYRVPGTLVAAYNRTTATRFALEKENDGDFLLIPKLCQ